MGGVAAVNGARDIVYIVCNVCGRYQRLLHASATLYEQSTYKANIKY